VRQIL